MAKFKWVVKEELKESDYRRFPGYNRVALQLLFNRGLKEAGEIENFLTLNDFGDPFIIPDMAKFVSRILEAKERNEKIVIHGDYDVDGICASAILYLYLKDIMKMADVAVYIPNRFEEGYGFSAGTLKKFIDEKFSLIITVDCGIKDYGLVETAKKNHIDVIISDHHKPGEKLPDAYALIHPMYYIYNNLCGAGVAFKMIQALDKKLNIHHAQDFIDLVGLGTVCDIMELKGENRLIVKRALERLRDNKRAGFEELFNLINLPKKSIDIYHIGYVIGPRINAAGRLKSAYESLGLLIDSDVQSIRKHAIFLDNINKERQMETANALEKSLNFMNENKYINIVYIENISVGIIGLVAGKLTELTDSPSIVLTDDSDSLLYAASCRSIDDFDIVDSLNIFKDLLVSYGGHKKAAGLKIKKENYSNFKNQMSLYARNLLQNRIPGKTLYIDLVLDLSLADIESIYKDIMLLDPYGESNPRPVFSSNMEIVNIFNMGENGKHLKLMLRPFDDKKNFSYKLIEAVGFNMGSLCFKAGDKIDIVYNITKNVWNNQEKLQLNLIDISAI